jgi:hypothetical protein
MRRELDGWRSVRGRSADGAIVSDERVQAARPVVERSEEGARRLGETYWLEVTRASRGIVHRRDTPTGIELRLLGRGPCLFRFGPAETACDSNGVLCRYPIRGGLLARRAGGAITLSQMGDELHAAVVGFVPRCDGALYEQVQRRLHVAISRQYFMRLLGEALA